MGIQLDQISPPDFILMDINQSGMGGVQVLRELKAMEGTQYIN